MGMRSTAAVVAVVVTAAAGGAALLITPTGGGSSFPDASNTGVPSGTSLTAYSGPNPITVNGTTITGKTFSDCLFVRATGVTITNSKLTPDDICGVVVDETSGWTPSAAAPLVIEDSDIACNDGGVGTYGPGTAASSSYMTLRRVDIYGCENGMDVNYNVTVEDSYIHDLWEDPTVGVDGTHTDGIQFGGEHIVGACCATTVPGAANITIQGNTIYGYGNRVSNCCPALGTSAIITNRGPTNIDNNILIDGNLMSGGTTIYCEQDGYAAVDERVTNNHFTTVFGAFVPGPPFISTDCADEDDTSGNVIHETGAPVVLD